MNRAVTVSFGPTVGLSTNAPAASRQRWPWMWNVWKLSSMPNAFISTAWAGELGDWVLEQVTAEREVAIALYRLQIELLGRPEAAEVRREWGEGLRALGARVLHGSASPAPELDTRLVVAALDGLRLAVLSA